MKGDSMKLFLIAGNKNSQYKQALDTLKDIEVAGYLKDISNAAEYFNNYAGPPLHTICIFEEGIEGKENFEDQVFKLFNTIILHLKETKIMLFCNNQRYVDQLAKFTQKTDALLILHQEQEWEIEDIKKQLMRHLANQKVGYKGLKSKLKNLLGSRKKEDENEEDDFFSDQVTTKDDPYAIYDNRYSVGMRKVIAITGHGNSGKTSTAANLAVLAARQNLNTVIVDFDIQYRGMNLYFSEFGEKVNRYPDLAYSLVRCLVKPETYELNTLKINDNLKLMTLAYTISEKDKMLDVINPERLMSLLSYLRKNFNVTVVDIPIEMFSKYSEIISQVDSIGVCIHNNIHSIIRSVFDIKKHIPHSKLELFKIKTKTIITQYSKENTYNGMQLSQLLVMDIIQSLDDILDEHVAGTVSYNANFNDQMDTGILSSLHNQGFHTQYTQILDNLL